MNETNQKKRLFFWLDAKVKDTLKAAAALAGFSQESYAEKLIKEGLEKQNLKKND